MAEFNLDVTLNKAVAEFRSLDPLETARRTGSEYVQTDGCFKLRYFNCQVCISHPDATFINSKEIPIVEKILILHYLITASGRALANQFISFKELPGGEIYKMPFTNRSIRPFLQFFGNRPQVFRKAAEKLGGRPIDAGDISYTLMAFPKVPVTVVLWKGDEEFPASANILFDKSAPGYLPTEDYAFLAGLTVAKLKNSVFD